MKRFALVIALALAAAGLTVPTPAAALTLDEVCARTFTSPLNLSAAAQVKVPNGKKRPKAAGMASAQALAAQVLVDTHQNPCDEPLDESVQANIDSVQELVDSGETDLAREYLLGLVQEQQYTPQRGRTSRAATTCEGFDSHDLKLPEQVRAEIGIAQKAQALGYNDIADTAIAKAVTIATDWANSGADGQASSIPDWMGVTAKLELIGADQGAIDKARASMTKAAQDAYDQYNLSACRATIESITCFLKAAQFMAATGAEPASFAKDVAYQVSTARTIKQGKDDPCPVEKYLLRITSDSKGGDGQNSHIDTGLIHLTVRDGRITSADRGPLVISSGRGTCWVKDENDVWQRVGEGTLTGGSFPYRVSGTDDGTLLHVRLAQKAKVSAQIGGDLGCQTMAALAVGLLNEFLAELGRTGLELPAGATDVDQTETTYGVFEPTGETTTDVTHIVFRMVAPKRTAPQDPYS